MEESVKLILDQSFASFQLRSVFKQAPLESQNLKYTTILAYVLSRIYCGPTFLQKIPSDLLNDRKFLKTCLKQFGALIAMMGKEMRGDFEMGLTAVKSRVSAYEFLSDELKRNRLIVLNVVKSGGDFELLKEIFEGNEEFCKDEGIIYESVWNNAMNLTLAHQDLRRNFDFVMKCVKLDGNCIRYVDVSLKTNEELVTIAVLKVPSILLITPLVKKESFVLNCIKKKSYPKFLKYLKTYNNNEKVLCEIFKKNGLQLEFAHDSIKSSNESIVMIAVNQDGRALEFVKRPLLENELINLTAIRNHPLALEFAHEKFKSNLEIVKCAVDRNLDALQFASFEIQKEFKREIQNSLDGEYIWTPKLAFDILRTSLSNSLNRNEILEKIRIQTKLGCLRPEQMQVAIKDEEIMLEAIKNDDDSALYYLKNNYEPEFIRKAIRINKRCLLYISPNTIYKRDFILDACSNYSIKDFENQQHVDGKFTKNTYWKDQ